MCAHTHTLSHTILTVLGLFRYFVFSSFLDVSFSRSHHFSSCIVSIVHLSSAIVCSCELLTLRYLFPWLRYTDRGVHTLTLFSGIDLDLFCIGNNNNSSCNNNNSNHDNNKNENSLLSVARQITLQLT